MAGKFLNQQRLPENCGVVNVVPAEDGIPGLCDSFPRGSPAEMQFFSNSDNVPESRRSTLAYTKPL